MPKILSGCLYIIIISPTFNCILKIIFCVRIFLEIINLLFQCQLIATWSYQNVDNLQLQLLFNSNYKVRLCFFQPSRHLNWSNFLSLSVRPVSGLISNMWLTPLELMNSTKTSCSKVKWFGRLEFRQLNSSRTRWKVIRFNQIQLETTIDALIRLKRICSAWAMVKISQSPPWR